MAHQHQAAAAGALEVLDRGRVGHVGRVEAGALVGDLDGEAVGLHLVGDLDRLVAVVLVAVLDRVDEGLFEGELDGEDFAVVEEERLEGALDVVLDTTRLRRIAGDDQVQRGACVYQPNNSETNPGRRATAWRTKPLKSSSRT